MFKLFAIYFCYVPTSRLFYLIRNCFSQNFELIKYVSRYQFFVNNSALITQVPIAMNVSASKQIKKSYVKQCLDQETKDIFNTIHVYNLQPSLHVWKAITLQPTSIKQ